MAERHPGRFRQRSLRRQVGNQMFGPTMGVIAGELTRSFADAATFGQQLPAPENIAVHYTGDFSVFAFAYVLENTVFSGIDNTAVRRGLSMGIPAAGMTLAETAHVIGTPDVAQLPAGFLGLIAYWGLVTFFEHRARRQAGRSGEGE